MDLAARHLQELRNLHTVLQEMDFPSRLLQKADPLPQHALVTRVPMPAPHESLEMVLTFYPIEPDTIQHVLLLQYYVQLPYTLNEATRDHYRLLLPDLNAKAVVGHFGLDVGTGTPHYRYVQALPSDRAITRTAVADVLVLVAFTPPLFADTLTALAAGTLTAEAARTQIQARYQR